MKLICVFLFAYAKSWFSHEAAQIKTLIRDHNDTIAYIYHFACILGWLRRGCDHIADTDL